MSTPTDNNRKPERRSSQKKRTKLDEAGFWDALSGEHVADRRKPVSLNRSTEDITELAGKNKANQADENRRDTLMSMLRASEERFERASSRRSSPLVAGITVEIVGGNLKGISAEVLDADYINNRVLLALPEHEGPHWVAFRHVMAVDKP